MHAKVLGHDIFYTIRGRGASPECPPMLTMHGGPGFDHTYMMRGLDVFSDEIEIIYYDQLGNGRSTRPDVLEGGMEVWAEEAEALRAHLGHERVVLFGHSFGSFIALEYALRHGDRLAGLVLCASAPALDFPEVSMQILASRATPEQLVAVSTGIQGRAANDEEYHLGWKQIMPVYVKNYTPELGEAMSAGIQYSALAFNHGFGKCLPAWSVASRLHEIHAPTLILSGRHDWITPPMEGGERLHAGIRGSELVIFEESGHYPFFEESERFQSVMRAWLRRIR